MRKLTGRNITKASVSIVFGVTLLAVSACGSTVEHKEPKKSAASNASIKNADQPTGVLRICAKEDKCTDLSGNAQAVDVQTNLGPDFQDSISTIVNATGTQFCFYNDANFQGDRLKLAPGETFFLGSSKFKFLGSISSFKPCDPQVSGVSATDLPVEQLDSLTRCADGFACFFGLENFTSSQVNFDANNIGTSDPTRFLDFTERNYPEGNPLNDNTLSVANKTTSCLRVFKDTDFEDSIGRPNASPIATVDPGKVISFLPDGASSATLTALQNSETTCDAEEQG
ncbi:hypothetical protein OHA02_51370 [Streptomyces phaeochromogenes]|nr:hypothetical protein [Streptomyces phaeochromogenes]